MEFSYEKVTHQDLDVILKLGEAVNDKHVVPLLNFEGQKAIKMAFKSDIDRVKDASIYSAIKATIDNEIIGYIAWRDESYIGHLYVKTEYHGFGVAKGLVEEMKAVSGAKLISVKASIYALGFYKKVGFKPVSEELSLNGIRYVPMVLNVQQRT
ncbi:acetyltransferase [Aliivibrio sp. 1S165]|uniref:GNAT family N-acetyltransferase n=1 Tax=unclassified Aliivibrio TaxID=2645654 RepID=UPI00080EA5A9|nr:MULTISPECIES: GNAT family N-acetyltransferase [unclassified Aliivibrio]OCH14568.1 acetyltransferase [Aliivibrio sp. 1S165]OCH31975.1 acetyltransferase [Aliivibrio sp. 1S175]